jgi:hypothetical protein
MKKRFGTKEKGGRGGRPSRFKFAFNDVEETNCATAMTNASRRPKAFAWKANLFCCFQNQSAPSNPTRLSFVLCPLSWTS